MVLISFAVDFLLVMCYHYITRRVIIMAQIKQFDPRSGITYVYESISYWDKEKQQSRSKRNLIGKIDKESGKIVPTDGRGKNRGKKKQNVITQCETSKIVKSRRYFYGSTFLLNEISQKLGIQEDLKASFPDTYKQILSVAYFMILEDPSPLTRFEKWDRLHKHPYGKNISSQRASDLFASITEDGKNKYFSRQQQRHSEDEYSAYDTTSITSYSELLKQVALGKNKEDEKMPHLNLALVFGEKSMTPFYYRKLAGNISDVLTIRNLLTDFKVLGFEKMKLILDRGFYSEKNINELMKSRLKFLIGTKISISFVKKELDQVYDELTTFDKLNEQYDLYSMTLPTEWNYTQNRPNKGDVLKEKRRIYLHLYYNIDKATEEKKWFDRKIAACYKELLSGKREAKHDSYYKKYFTVNKTPKRGIKVSVKQKEIDKAKRYHGYFALLSNEKMDSIKAIHKYRGKDVIEKSFGNLKERLNMRRTLVSSEQSLDGKIFVGFVGLVLLSYIRNKMHEAELFKKYTMQSLFDTLDVIEYFENPGVTPHVGEILKKQMELYQALGVPIPS